MLDETIVIPMHGYKEPEQKSPSVRSQNRTPEQRRATRDRMKAVQEQRGKDFDALLVDATAAVAAHAGHAGPVPKAARIRVDSAARSLAMVKLLWAEVRRAGPVEIHARVVRPATRELERWQGRLDRQLAELPGAGAGDGKEEPGPFDEFLRENEAEGGTPGGCPGETRLKPR